jgi:hypothetical protein
MATDCNCGQPETWRCFHCCEVFTDEAAAREHFGATEAADAACLLDTGQSLKAYRQMEDEVAQLRAENETLDYKAQAGEMQSVELERLFGKGANTAYGAWLRLDEKEGERLVEKERADTAERRLREAEGRAVKLREALIATAEWLESFCMPPNSTIQEKNDALEAIDAALNADRRAALADPQAQGRAK